MKIRWLLLLLFPLLPPSYCMAEATAAPAPVITLGQDLAVSLLRAGEITAESAVMLGVAGGDTVVLYVDRNIRTGEDKDFGAEAPDGCTSAGPRVCCPVGERHLVVNSIKGWVETGIDCDEENEVTWYPIDENLWEKLVGQAKRQANVSFDDTLLSTRGSQHLRRILYSPKMAITAAGCPRRLDGVCAAVSSADTKKCREPNGPKWYRWQFCQAEGENRWVRRDSSCTCL